jgi:hypothetical protein
LDTPPGCFEKLGVSIASYWFTDGVNVATVVATFLTTSSTGRNQMNRPRLQPVTAEELLAVEGGGILRKVVDFVVKVAKALPKIKPPCIGKVCA